MSWNEKQKVDLTAKHRPTSFQEIVGQQETIPEIKAETKHSNPNFLFWGSPGTGKTTTAKVISIETHGDTKNLYTINASEQTGKNDIDDMVEQYSKQYTLTGNPPVILFDEADQLSRAAQKSLRSQIQNTKSIIIFVSNDKPTKTFHKAILDRCSIYEFSDIPKKTIMDYLENIASREGIDIQKSQIEYIASFANGSLRKALKELQKHRAKQKEHIDKQPQQTNNQERVELDWE